MIVYRGVIELNLWLLAAGLAITLVTFGWAVGVAHRERRLIAALVADGMDRRLAVAQVRLRRHRLYVLVPTLGLSFWWMKEFSMNPVAALPPEVLQVFWFRRVAALIVLGVGSVISIAASLVMQRMYRIRLKENPS